MRDQRPTHIELLWARGEGLLLERVEGETFPCDGKTNIFYPDRWNNRATADMHARQAIALCQQCHRKDECFTQADIRREQHGIWGGIDFYYRYGLGLARSRRVERERHTRSA